MPDIEYVKFMMIISTFNFLAAIYVNGMYEINIHFRFELQLKQKM